MSNSAPRTLLKRAALGILPILPKPVVGVWNAYANYKTFQSLRSENWPVAIKSMLSFLDSYGAILGVAWMVWCVYSYSRAQGDFTLTRLKRWRLASVLKRGVGKKVSFTIWCPESAPLAFQLLEIFKGSGWATNGVGSNMVIGGAARGSIDLVVEATQDLSESEVLIKYAFERGRIPLGIVSFGTLEPRPQFAAFMLRVA